MAKNSKKNIEKETRRLIESISDLVKKKGDRYKFKAKKSKKVLKKVRRTCPHWIIRNGKCVPTLVQDNEHPGNWKCNICGASFPIQPLEDKYAYRDMTDKFISYVDQMFFWSVKFGGNADDTKMFTQLKLYANRFKKSSAHILKRMKAKDKLEQKNRRGAMDQFSTYGYNYNHKS